MHPLLLLGITYVDFSQQYQLTHARQNSKEEGMKGKAKIFGTISAQASNDTNGRTKVQVQVGCGKSFNVTSVRTQRIPSEPITKS